VRGVVRVSGFGSMRVSHDAACGAVPVRSANVSLVNNNDALVETPAPLRWLGQPATGAAYCPQAPRTLPKRSASKQTESPELQGRDTQSLAIQQKRRAGARHTIHTKYCHSPGCAGTVQINACPVRPASDRLFLMPRPTSDGPNRRDWQLCECAAVNHVPKHSHNTSSRSSIKVVSCPQSWK
jgi:hypothetical protein